MKKLLVILMLAPMINSTPALCQKEKLPRYFGTPIWTDSASTMFFPLQYNEKLLSDHKIALGGDYYSNILVYDFANDRYRKLFPNDTYIESFQTPYVYPPARQTSIRNTTGKYVLMLVKEKDFNDNGRIDEKDPSVLFASTLKGENLIRLTEITQNVVSFDVFPKQGFVLIRVQRDSDGNKFFDYHDKDFYYQKVDLDDLKVGKPIEID